MRLPPFEPPTLAELRAWWRTRDEQSIQRLILEIQRQRLTLLELRNLIDSGVQQARAADRTLVERGEPLMTLRIRIAQEVLRVGDIDDTRQMSRAAQEKLAVRTEGQMEYAREGRLRRQRRNI
ncbi:hypothetical protein R75461_02799 [Paraburkholderia nemoris]|jgi:hypothetical protein|uniref:hypothetical protein n=1 Tax=Paraburkholderia nemoris TaxID=2793076 RepID=UPI00190D9F79|nr:MULTISPECIES: hypothetical protein [Paraburkholderia]MBK5148883.1 hypothetical protein [Burkholderia sp. R-69608]MBK3741750.1 hypothetical protein [Paraburkholderia aspalathi]MBK3782032.1 hypothetical protein [Paraburkholderia aspalathi]CAE6738923.1 hypothetical protein LMG22931_02588 [Paraburkholderia nemoris]CAE6748286.1 hypothetical protein R75461_02799 [Paraburkholderia nemoris]